jgi:serine/threonine-protein kinase
MSLELRLLGAAGLRRPDGQELSEVVRQPKRLALLAYLAVEGAPRFHRRDTLLAHFWPELDDQHARASLRRTLHFLRSYLGDDVLPTRGDEVGVSVEHLWCDVPAFLTDLEEGRPEQALDRYRGDLLEGFFVPSAPGFERWLEGERERLRRVAAGAAWQLAEAREAAGDAGQAARWGRRAATLAPDDEMALRRLLSLFDRLGDRAAAAQVYEDFAARLKEEFDLEPSPETRALIQGVRTRSEIVQPTAAATPRAAPELVPNRIAVFPFAVRAGPELAYLREGLVDLFSVKLDGAGDLRTVDPHALLGHLRGGADELRPEAARTTAAHFGAGAFVLGSVVSAGDRLVVRVGFYQTAGGDEVRVDAEAEGEEGLSALVDDVVRRLLAGRSTSLGGHLGRLGATMTASLTALKAYLAGERAFRQGRHVDAMHAYEAALAGDAEFALARYRLAASRAATGRLHEARRDAAAATRGRHLAVHVRLLLAGQVAWLDGDLDTAEKRYLAVLDDRPDDVDAWFALGRLQIEGNPLRGRRAAAARAALERTVALDPRHVGAIAHLARLAALESRTDDVAALVERFLALSPEGDEAAALHAIRATISGDRAAYDALVERLTSAGPTAVARGVLDLALLAREADPALDALERVSALPAAPALGAFPALVAAHLAYAFGVRDRAERALKQATKLDRDAALVHRSWLVATTPGVDAAVLAALAEELDAWAPSDSAPDADAPALPATVESWPSIRAYLRGLIALGLGMPDEAERIADEWAALVAGEPASLGTALARGVRARAALARNQPEAAVTALDGFRLGPWIHRGRWSPFASLAAQRLARGEALLALGRRDEAESWLGGLGELSAFELALRPRAQVALART